MNCEHFDQLLDDYLDDRLDPGRRAQMEAHASTCASCRSRRDGLREVLAGAAALPRTIAPPRTLWPDIATRLPARTASLRLRPDNWRRWVPLAAAAILLVAVTAVLTLRFAPRPTATAAAPPLPTVAAQEFAADREYALAAADLEQLVEEGRDQLAPATIQALERSLALIDAAIDEARAALAADPANADVRALLWGAHRQKLDLLERAVRLTRS